MKDVSGPSSAATELVRGIASVVHVLRENVDHKKWLRNFYDKAAKCEAICSIKRHWLTVYSMLLTRFTVSLVKSRPIQEACAEQVCPLHSKSKVAHSAVDSHRLTSPSW